MSTPRNNTARFLRGGFVASLGFWVVAASAVVLVLLLIVRRLMGALDSPLPFGPALFCGFLLAVGGIVLRLQMRRRVPHHLSKTAVNVVCALVWMAVLAITLSSMNALAILALWLPVIAAEAGWQTILKAAPVPAAHVASEAVERHAIQSNAPNVEVAQENVVQQLTRTRDEHGETIAGTVRIDFQPLEQTTVSHVVFCPPLARDPEIDVEVLDDEGVTVRAAECRSYGVRLEAKRGRDASAAASVTVSLEVFATATDAEEQPAT